MCRTNLMAFFWWYILVICGPVLMAVFDFIGRCHYFLSLSPHVPFCYLLYRKWWLAVGLFLLLISRRRREKRERGKEINEPWGQSEDTEARLLTWLTHRLSGPWRPLLTRQQRKHPGNEALELSSSEKEIKVTTSMANLAFIDDDDRLESRKIFNFFLYWSIYRVGGVVWSSSDCNDTAAHIWDLTPPHPVRVSVLETCQLHLLADHQTKLHHGKSQHTSNHLDGPVDDHSSSDVDNQRSRYQ